MSGKKEELAKKLAGLFVVDTSNPNGGIKISLPSREPATRHALTPTPMNTPTNTPAPATISRAIPAPAHYGVRIENGRVVRESRHGDSQYAGWAQAIGPAETEIETLRLVPKSRSRTPTLKLDELEYVVVDTETTGGAVMHGHRITEIAIVRVNAHGKVLHEYATLVNPGRRIPAMITALTHIDNEMVRVAPRFEDIAHDVRSLLEGRIFVAHNAPFDWGFVSGELIRTTGKPLHGLKLCTVRLARKVVPEVRRRSLDSLSYFFNVNNEARHRAYGDARATAKIFRRMMDRVRERDVETWQQLEHLTLRRSQRRKRTAMPMPMENI